MNQESNKDNQKSNKELVSSSDSIAVSSETKKQPFRSFQQNQKPNKDRPTRTKQDFRKTKEQSEFTEKVIWIRRINKVTTGGRRLRFSAAVVVGNKKGTVGLGVAKANEVNDAIKKAIAAAHKEFKKIEINNKNHSVYHHGIGTYCASKILLHPAKEGIGIKAGGSARDVIELAGIQNIFSKSLGSNNKINLARATIEGLSSLKSEEFFKNKVIKKKSTSNVTQEKKIGAN